MNGESKQANSLVPEEGVNALREAYLAGGIMASYEEVNQDLLQLVGLYKLLLSGPGKRGGR